MGPRPAAREAASRGESTGGGSGCRSREKQQGACVLHTGSTPPKSKKKGGTPPAAGVSGNKGWNAGRRSDRRGWSRCGDGRGRGPQLGGRREEKERKKYEGATCWHHHPHLNLIFCSRPPPTWPPPSPSTPGTAHCLRGKEKREARLSHTHHVKKSFKSRTSFFFASSSSSISAPTCARPCPASLSQSIAGSPPSTRPLIPSGTSSPPRSSTPGAPGERAGRGGVAR